MLKREELNGLPGGFERESLIAVCFSCYHGSTLENKGHVRRKTDMRGDR